MEDFINEFKLNMLGPLSLASYASGFLFAAIGAIILLRIKALKRDKLSDSTPYKFSWWFMIRDNIQKLLNGLLLTYVVFRFAPEILNQDFSMFLALLVGLSSTQIAGWFAKFEIGARS
jgi:hypothetical protein